MDYEVLARKWRPQGFDEVVGQDHVTGTLKNALRSGRVAHAYLFVGSRGIGKTSVARIFAKALNCAEGPTEKPCGKCASCKEITAGSNLDVVEIDGASNRGIDEIRELRESVKYMPSGRYKIYIIDEVHMLTTEAFNALLKTLEEPPAHVKFFFATTEPQKVPATILSRCQRFDFRRIPVKLIVDRLSEIAAAEGSEVDEKALLAVARAAEGGLRDAESALDQLISFCGASISESDVLSIFGLVSADILGELATAVIKGDVAGVIEIVEGFDKNGKDMQRIVLELLEHFRNLLIFMHIGSQTTPSEFDVPETQVGLLEEQAKLADPDRIMKITDILVETNDRLRYALSAKTLFETALIRCARAARIVSLDEIMAQLKALAGTTTSGVQPVAHDADSPDKTQQGLFAVPEKKTVDKEKTVKKPVDTSDELDKLENKWLDVLEKAASFAVLAKSVFMDSRPVAVFENRVVVGFDPEFADKIEQAEITRNFEALKKAIKPVLGRPVDVEFKLLDENAVSPLPADNVVAENVEATNCSTPADAGDTRRQATDLRQQCLENKTVRNILETFNGSIVDIRK